MKWTEITFSYLATGIRAAVNKLSTQSAQGVLVVCSTTELEKDIRFMGRRAPLTFVEIPRQPLVKRTAVFRSTVKLSTISRDEYSLLRLQLRRTYDHVLAMRAFVKRRQSIGVQCQPRLLRRSPFPLCQISDVRVADLKAEDFVNPRRDGNLVCPRRHVRVQTGMRGPFGRTGASPENLPSKLIAGSSQLCLHVNVVAVCLRQSDKPRHLSNAAEREARGPDNSKDCPPYGNTRSSTRKPK